MTTTSATGPRVMLASMPWAALGEPSLGLALLAACLRRAGVTVKVRHVNLTLLRYLRASTYVGLANAYAINDFLFTHDLDPEVSGVQYRLARERVEELCQLGILGDDGEDPATLLERLLDARRSLFPGWLGECAAEIAAWQPTLLGLTCLFDQTMASIALARRVRDALPDTLIVLGGYALEGPVAREILRCFPWIDGICLGEGEPAIEPLAAASIGARELGDIPNVLTRKSAPRRALVVHDRRGRRLATRDPVDRAPPIAMDDSPIPDFDDYFADLARLARDDRVEVEVDTLPVESSRGCWWGQKNHCTFCGIDDETMKYRARSPRSTMAMLDALAARHPIKSFRFSDYILPHRYFDTLLPDLAAREVRYHLECETKANLTRSHFERLRAAGFGECQPGIESFSTSVLRKMSKGVTGLQNIQTLVLGRSHGVKIHYNVLYGFPDDELAEYQRMLEVIPRLYHLDPPHGCQPVEITRFAPLQADPARFGIEESEHAELYEVLFSPRFLRESGFDLDAYAYYFERSFSSDRALEAVHGMVQMQINHWKRIAATRAVELRWQGDGRGIRFHDSRHDEDGVTRIFGAAHRQVFETCAGEARTMKRIAASTGLAAETVAAIVADLDEARVVVREGDRVLGLAIRPTAASVRPAFRRKWVVA